MRTRPHLLAVAALLTLASAVRAGDVSIQSDVAYGHKDGLAMTFDVYTPKNANGVGVFWLVSGAWRSGWGPAERSIGRYKILLDHGFTVFAVRHSSSPKYVVPEIVDDLRRGVRYVRHNASRFGIDPDRIGIYGSSSGGHLTLMLATTSDPCDPKAKDPVDRESSRVASVVAICPAVDLRKRMPPPAAESEKLSALNFDPQRAAEFSPILHVTPDDPPTLLIHGDKDQRVPIQESRDILEVFKKAGVPSELLVMKDAPHGFVGDDIRKSDEAVTAWFEKTLVQKGK